MKRTAILLSAAAFAAALAGCDDAPQSVSQAARKPAPLEENKARQTNPAPAASPVAQLEADKALSGKVKQALEAKPAGGAGEGHIEVAAADGVVTLYGTVAGAREKERIALLAMSVDGVRSVVNNLVVVQGS